MKKPVHSKKTTAKADPTRMAAPVAAARAAAAALRRKNRNLGIALGLLALALASSVFIWRFSHPVAQLTITQPQAGE